MQPSPQDPATLNTADRIAPAGSKAATPSSPPAQPAGQSPTLLTGGAAGIARTLTPPPMALPVSATEAGLALPGYEVLGVLGKGGMGVVYKARQVGLGRVVALKMILHAEHAGPQERQRFKAEAEAVARLQHPHIVQVFEVGEHNGLPFFSLEFCGGGSLADKLDGTPLQPREAARLVETLARAMQAAHQAGIVHRDLKPANVLLAEDGTPKVTDFGLAKRLDVPGQTQTGAVMGTPSYMAPEQAGGKTRDVGPAADTYALGAILYELLTGHPPFKGATVMETLIQVVADEPVAPSRLQRSIPLDLETICLKCLEKNPKRRYASAEELAEELHRYQAGEPILARPISVWQRGLKWAGRKPTTAALLVMTFLALVGLGVGGGLFAWQAEEGRRKAEEYAHEEGRLRKEADQKRVEVAEQKGIVEKQAGDLKQQTTNLTAALGRAEKAETRSRYELAYNSVQLANREWEAGRAVRARELLDDVPPDLRHWEWGYLRRTIRGGYCTLYGHTGSVTGVAFSSDGKRLASSSSDGTVRVWDATTGREFLSLKGHTGGVTSMAFSPDARRLVSGGQDKMVRVWEVATGRQLLALEGHTERVASVAFSPEGRRLVSSSDDATVRVWDAGTGRQLLTLKGFSNGFGSVVFSPDGRRLAGGSYFSGLRVWDATTGLEVLTVTGDPVMFTSVAFSPDGKRLAGGGMDGTVRAWDAATGRQLLAFEGHTGNVHSVAFSPDSRRLASGSWDNTVRVWDATTGRQLLALEGHTGPAHSVDPPMPGGIGGGMPTRPNTGGVNGVAFSPDGRRLASGGGDGTVRVWDTTTSAQALTLKAQVNSVAFSPDGRRLAGGGGDGTLRVWDPAGGRELLALKGHTGPVRVAFSPDGKRLASGGDNTVRVWELDTGKEVLSLKGDTGRVTSVCLSPDGQRLAGAGVTEEGGAEGDMGPDGKRLAGGGNTTVRVWDAVTGRKLLAITVHASPVESITFSPDGKRLAGGSRDGTGRVWDTATGRQLLALEGHTGPVSSAVFSPDDGKYLASGSWDNTVRVWDTATGDQVFMLKGHTRGITSVAFSPDGKRLASGSWDSTVRVWDATTGHQLLALEVPTSAAAGGKHPPLERHIDTATGRESISLSFTGRAAGGVTSVAFSPDGRRLAGGGDGTVRIWDAATKPPVLALTGHADTVTHVAFSPDGKWLASGSWDCTVRVWDAATGRQLRTLKGHTDPVSRVTFSPDGRMLWSRDVAGGVKAWDVSTGKPVRNPGKPPPLAPAEESLGARHPSAPLLALPQDDTILLIDVSPPDADELAFRRAKARFDPSWHERQAAEAARTGQWFVAAFHLGRLLPSRPGDANLHVRRAHALARLGQAEPAARHYLQAVLLHPQVRLWPLDPQAALRGNHAARGGDWPTAVEEFRLAAHQPGAGPAIWEGLLLALRASRQDAACRAACRAMLDHFAARRDPVTTWNLIFHSRVAGCREADARDLAQLAAQLVAKQRNASNLDLLGAALYRAKRFEDALKALQESIKVQGKGGYVDTWLFLAMTHQRLGHADEARKWFAKCESWVRAQRFGAWQDYVRWELLLGEANALVNPSPPGAARPKGGSRDG